jgi:hypothetical protein
VPVEMQSQELARPAARRNGDLPREVRGMDDPASLQRQQLPQRVRKEDIPFRGTDVDHRGVIPQPEDALRPRRAANGVRVELPFQAGDEHGRNRNAEQSACRSRVMRQFVDLRRLEVRRPTCHTKPLSLPLRDNSSSVRKIAGITSDRFSATTPTSLALVAVDGRSGVPVTPCFHIPPSLLYRDLGLYRGVIVVIHNLKVFVFVVKNGRRSSFKNEPRKWIWLTT